MYHGEEAEWLRLQALQLMLRLQVSEIRRLWDIPEILEVSLVSTAPVSELLTLVKAIVRELWAYQLAISPLPSPPGSSSSRHTSIIPPDEEKTDEKTDDKHDGVDDDSDSSSDADDMDKEEAALDDDLFAELSERSESEDDNDQRENGKMDGKGPKWKRKRRLRVSDTLVTLILGLWILRIPVLNIDIQTSVHPICSLQDQQLMLLQTSQWEPFVVSRLCSYHAHPSRDVYEDGP